MTLTEIQRQEYLQIMGVQSYFPRYILPGALESKQCEWPAELLVDMPNSTSTEKIVETHTKPELEPFAEDNKAKPQHSQDKLDNSDAEKSDNEASKEVDNEFREDGARFQLAFIRVTDRLCILNLMPYVGRKQLTAVHQKLLINIIKSLGIAHEDVFFDDLPFRWPFTEGEHVDKSKTAARAALIAFLEQKLTDSKFDHLLVMGEMVMGFVLDEDAEQSLTAGDFHQGENIPWQTAYTRSLDEILNRPQFKKDVWQQLKPAMSKLV